MQYQHIFKDIKGFNGTYQISNFGMIRSYKYNEWRVLKQSLGGKGHKQYMYVDLCKNGVSKKYSVHRLVANVFIENKNKLSQVNHKDGNKLNNNVDNLEWVDGINNMKHAREVLGFNNKGENSKSAKLTEIDVRNIIELYNTDNYTYKEISEMYKVHSGHICSLVKRKFWKHLKIS